MAKLDRRVQSFAWLFAHTPGGSVGTMSPEQILKAQERLAGTASSPSGVTGGWRGRVSTENRIIARTVRGPGSDLPVGDQAGGGPVIVYFHGGGWTLGALDQSDWLCSQVCHRRRRRRGVRRLPAGAHLPVPDGRAGQSGGGELGRHHGDELSWTSRRIGLMGDSAGGNLATVVSQILRDRGGPEITHQALMYPATDLRTPEDFDPAAPRAPTGRSCPRPAW